MKNVTNVGEGDRGFVFGYLGTVVEASKTMISFEVDAYKDTTRPVLVVPVELFQKIA